MVFYSRDTLCAFQAKQSPFYEQALRLRAEFVLGIYDTGCEARFQYIPPAKVRILVSKKLRIRKKILALEPLDF